MKLVCIHAYIQDRSFLLYVSYKWIMQDSMAPKNLKVNAGRQRGWMTLGVGLSDVSRSYIRTTRAIKTFILEKACR